MIDLPPRRLGALAAILTVGVSLTACAGAPTRSGFLTTYDGLTPASGAVRAEAEQRTDTAALAQVQKIAIAPTRLIGAPDWMTQDEKDLLQAEVDAQLCFELARRYEIVEDDAAQAKVRAAVTDVKPTNRAASAVAAVGEYFIPGPIGLRAPGTLGALSAEAEMLLADGRQVAAITWTRAGTPIGTDSPSLSRIGDAMQFARPFAAATAKALTDPEVKREAPEGEPCARYGSRFRPGATAAKFVTGLYMPADRREALDDAPEAETAP